MIRGINKVILVGNVDREPDVRQTPTGTQVLNLSVATSEMWQDNAGQDRIKKEWHRVVLFGKAAEEAARHLKLGDHVYVEGKLRTSKWTDKAGADRYTTEIVVSGFEGSVQNLSIPMANLNNYANNNYMTANATGGYQNPYNQQNPYAGQQAQYNNQPYGATAGYERNNSALTGNMPSSGYAAAHNNNPYMQPNNSTTVTNPTNPYVAATTSNTQEAKQSTPLDQVAQIDDFDDDIPF